MNPKFFCLGVLFSGITFAQAPQKTSLPLRDAVKIAVSQTNAAILADTKVKTRSYELATVKNNHYPDLKINAQYLRLANADVRLRTGQTNADPDMEPQAAPDVNSVFFGQANLSVPVFSGFKIRNAVKASQNNYRSEIASAAYTKEQTALAVIEYYAGLYKIQKSIELLRESLKSSNQRVTDFTAMEQNGLLARNDLLKSQLQVSQIQLSLDEAEKTERVLNYNLITLLKLPETTRLEISPENVDASVLEQAVSSESEALQQRQDLQAMGFAKKAAEDQIKVARADYFPSIALMGGYIALDLQNVVRVNNAMNFGVGLSYNLSSIFKNGKTVNAAQSRSLEAEQQQKQLTDQVKQEIVKAREEYELSLKQDKVYHQAVVQADENYRIVKDKYDNGLSDTNDLLEADLQDLNTKINLAYSKANILLKYYELLNATGQLTQTFQLN